MSVLVAFLPCSMKKPLPLSIVGRHWMTCGAFTPTPHTKYLSMTPQLYPTVGYMDSGEGYPWYGFTVGDNSTIYNDFGHIAGEHSSREPEGLGGDETLNAGNGTWGALILSLFVFLFVCFFVCLLLPSFASESIDFAFPRLCMIFERETRANTRAGIHQPILRRRKWLRWSTWGSCMQRPG